MCSLEKHQIKDPGNVFWNFYVLKNKCVGNLRIFLLFIVELHDFCLIGSKTKYVEYKLSKRDINSILEVKIEENIISRIP